MLDPKSLDEMARKLAQNLPPGLRDFQQEMERNMRASLQGVFSRLDLVTREEFDAQAKVLARTRAHLETLELRIAALEASATASQPTTIAPPPPDMPLPSGD